jgi:hypothetical protein
MFKPLDIADASSAVTVAFNEMVMHLCQKMRVNVEESRMLA